MNIDEKADDDDDVKIAAGKVFSDDKQGRPPPRQPAAAADLVFSSSQPRQGSIGSLGCIPHPPSPAARPGGPGQYATTLDYLSRPLLPSLTRPPYFLPSFHPLGRRPLFYLCCIM